MNPNNFCQAAPVYVGYAKYIYKTNLKIAHFNLYAYSATDKYNFLRF